MRTPRLALLLTAAALVLASGLSASADPITIYGCYGAGSAVVCDPSVDVPNVVEIGTDQVPVCTGSCDDVEVPSVEVNDEFRQGIQENARHIRDCVLNGC